MSAKTDDSKCCICTKYIRKSTGKPKRIKSQADVSEFSFVFQESKEQIYVGKVVCGVCRLQKYKKPKLDSSANNSNQNNSDADDPPFKRNISVAVKEVEYVEIQMKRTVSTHKYCCLCGARDESLAVIPDEARLQCLVKRRIFIPSGNRCCPKHIIHKRFFEDDLSKIEVYSNWSILQSHELSQVIQTLSVDCDSPLLDRLGNYQISEEQLNVFTGLNWENITELTVLLKSMRGSDNRTVVQALVVFLFKLRSGNSNKLISSILGLKDEQTVSHYTHQVIASFEKDVLPIHFGYTALTREQLITNHTSPIAEMLYESIDDKLIIICDGTYAYHQKSKNNEYQRKSFSVQKKEPLCKPFTISASDGYIINMEGPFYAKQNDASIMRGVIDKQGGLSSLLQPGDIFVVDRGFRDVKSYLEEKGYTVLMPAFKGKKAQLSTEEANNSRFVTKIRWAVEAVHGMLKMKYRLLDHVFDNKMIPCIGSFYRIASFLHNKFSKRLTPDEDHSEITNIMKSKMTSEKENTLAAFVEENRLRTKRLPFQKISAHDIDNFPRMTEGDLKRLFSGCYQYKQAICYLSEMIDDHGDINMDYVKDNDNILKVTVQSRHTQSKIYKCFIEYLPNSEGYRGVPRYCCDCPNGLRTVGCCSHVAAIIYYLSYARYLSRVPKPAQILSKIFDQENIDITINEDSDEDD